MTLVLHVASWRGHLPGQHVDIQLTAEDGYQAQRSYSITSPPEDELLTLTVGRVENGEVSQYLVAICVPATNLNCGDLSAAISSGPLPQVGLLPDRGWIGRSTCHGDAPTPRQEQQSRSCASAVSSRTLEDIIYRAELDAIAHRDGALRVVNTLTREKPERWMGHRGRIDKVLLAAECFPPSKTQEFLFVGQLLWLRMSRGFWWSLDMTHSRSRLSVSDPPEDRRYD